MEQEPTSKLAVLIDADNASPDIAEGLLREISKYGTASVRRIYGDWTNPNLRRWKTASLEHSLQPIQQFGHTVGKNATDSALIIDAMDLLHSRRFDGFCLVSSDSDFTRLASRIREEGLMVYGFGERKTPSALVKACDKFVFTDLLGGEEQPAQEIPAKATKEYAELDRLVRSAVDSASDENGWAHLGAVGTTLVKQAPEFDPRNYGFQKLGELAKALGLEIQRQGLTIQVRAPQAPPPPPEPQAEPSRPRSRRRSGARRSAPRANSGEAKNDAESSQQS
jgi:uncharacterized LabA/DUF88 family protein